MVTRLLAHPAVAPALVLGALGWGALMVGFLLAGPGLGAWADTLLVACFGWSGEARRYRLDALLLTLLQPPLFVAVVGLFYGDELRPWLRARAGRLAAAAGAALFLGPAAWLLLHAEVSATGLPPSPAALAATVRQGTPGPAFALLDHRGAPVSADSLRGQPVVLTFVYASCHGTCPALIARLRALEARHPASARFVAVTVDPERDTPEALAARATRWELGPAWHLLSGDPAAVRRLAAAHGVHVTRLPDGEIAHDNVVVLLDRAGRVAFTYRGLAHPEARLATALGQLIDEPGGS